MNIVYGYDALMIAIELFVRYLRRPIEDPTPLHPSATLDPLVDLTRDDKILPDGYAGAAFIQSQE